MNVYKNEWVTLQKQYFLRTVYDRSLNNPLNQSQIDILYKNLTLYSGYNAEVNFEFFKIILQNVPDDDDWYDYLKTFLGSFGRMKYVASEYPKRLWPTMGLNSSHSTSKIFANNGESSFPFLPHAIQKPMGKQSQQTRPSLRSSRSGSRR